MNDILTKLNDFMYTYVLIIMLVAVGVYFTIRTRGVQIRLLKDGIKSLLDKNTEEENGKKKVSSFQALMISTASRVGTGNIAGIATAIAARRTGSGILDVADGGDRGRIGICREYIGSGL